MMERTTYIDNVLQRLSIQVGSEIENILRDALNKTLDDVEQRFRVYAQRQQLVVNRQPIQFKRNISRIEKHIQRQFLDQEGRIFAAPDHVLKREYYPHRAAMKKCFKNLTRSVNACSSNLWDVLSEKHVMSVSDEVSIRECGSRMRQNEEFVSFLCGKLTLDDFQDIFLPALNTDHPHVYDELVVAMGEVEDEEERALCMACRVRSDVQVKRLATSLLRLGHIKIPEHGDLRGSGLSNKQKWSILGDVPDKDVIASLASKYPDFHKALVQVGTLTCSCAERCSNKDETGRAVERPMEVASGPKSETDASERDDFIMDMEEFVNPNENTGEYKMKHTDRGLCLIINNYKFSRDKLKERVGSDIDEKNLVSTFTKLGFLCVVEKNITSDKLKSLLKDYSINNDHSSSDAFVCCILSYGSKSNIYCADGVPVPIPEITSYFTASRCPLLAGKPKLFFIQSDRGRQNMESYTLPVQDEHYSSIKQESDDGYTLPREAKEVVPEVRADEAVPEVIADEADFLLGYSTVAGYVSYRSITKGSWYISKLCEVLDRDADRNDLLSCLLKVNGEVARGGDILRHLKQVPAPVFTLTKKLHLTIVPSI